MLFFAKRFVLLLYFKSIRLFIFKHSLGCNISFWGYNFSIYICWRVQAQSGDEKVIQELRKYN